MFLKKHYETNKSKHFRRTNQYFKKTETKNWCPHQLPDTGCNRSIHQKQKTIEAKKKMVEKRRYKIVGFRDLMDGTVRVILSPAEPVRTKAKQPGLDEMMTNPLGVAQNLMQSQMNSMVHDTFMISKQEYLEKKFVVGEIIIVTITKEKI